MLSKFRSKISSLVESSCFYKFSFWIIKILKSIGKFSFSNTALKSAKLPQSVEYIKDGTFSECENLEYINLSSSIMRIGNQAFENCEELKVVDLTDNLEQVGDYAFYNCKSLEGIVFPDLLKSIGVFSFSNTKLRQWQYGTEQNLQRRTTTFASLAGR